MFFALQPQSQPFIVRVVEAPPTHSTTLADVIIGSLVLTGIAVVVAVLCGLALAAILILWHRRHPAEADHLPSISPFAPPPSSPAR